MTRTCPRTSPTSCRSPRKSRMRPRPTSAMSKKFGDETIAGDKLRILNKTSELAQEVVKAGAAINRLLRNPRQAMAELVEAEVKQRELERLAARPPKHRRRIPRNPRFHRTQCHA